MITIIPAPLALRALSAPQPAAPASPTERHDMRIGVIHMTTAESSIGYSEMVQQNLERVMEPGTQIEHRYVKHLRRATDSARSIPMMLNQGDIVAEAVDLGRDSVDAILVACSGDPAVAEARAAVSIPVIGPMEASIGLALGYGWKFGIVTVQDRTWSTHLDQLVHAYRCEPRYVGMRKMHTPTSEIFTRGFKEPAFVVADLVDRSKELVDDGADVVLIGSGGLSMFASHHGVSHLEELDVPIMDTVSVGLKFAEMRASLHASLGLPAVSRAGWFERFGDEDVRRVTELFSR
jgi:allantoin racemase